MSRVAPMKARELFLDACVALRKYPNVIGVGIAPPRRGADEDAASVAFVVDVTHKIDEDDLSPEERLPPEFQGIRVDVQVRETGEWCAAAYGGVPITTGPEAGKLGFVAQGEDGALRALTVMHVLARDDIPVFYEHSPANERVVYVETDGGAQRIGYLEEGRMTSTSDIALVRLDAGVDVSAGLSGSGKQAAQPRDPDALLFADAARLAHHAGPVEGFFEAPAYAGSFDTDRRSHWFTGLLQFRMDVERGWSGGLIHDYQNRPICLLSFRGRKDSRRFAYGWPLESYYRTWKLKPIS